MGSVSGLRGPCWAGSSTPPRPAPPRGPCLTTPPDSERSRRCRQGRPESRLLGRVHLRQRGEGAVGPKSHPKDESRSEGTSDPRPRVVLFSGTDHRHYPSGRVLGPPRGTSGSRRTVNEVGSISVGGDQVWRTVWVRWTMGPGDIDRDRESVGDSSGPVRVPRTGSGERRRRGSRRGHIPRRDLTPGSDGRVGCVSTLREESEERPVPGDRVDLLPGGVGSLSSTLGQPMPRDRGVRGPDVLVERGVGGESPRVWGRTGWTRVDVGGERCGTRKPSLSTRRVTWMATEARRTPGGHPPHPWRSASPVCSGYRCRPWWLSSPVLYASLSSAGASLRAP